VGDGGHVNVTAGPDGTGYAVWVHQDSPGHEGQVQYCRIKRSTRTCDVTHTFALDGQQDIGSRPYVFLPGGSTVVVLAHECCFSPGDAGYQGQSDHTVIWTSTDGGATFPSSSTLVGTLDPSGQAVLSADGQSAYLIDDTVTMGESVQQVPVAGGPRAKNAALLPAHGATHDEYGGTVAALADGTVLAATDDFPSGGGSYTAHVMKLTGSDPNADTSWTTVQTEPAQLTHLVTGPHGTFLISATPDYRARLQAQKWNGSAFGPVHFVVPAGEDDIFPAAWEDAGGHVFVLYSDGGRNLTLRRSNDGTHWSSALRLAAARSGAFFDLRGSTAKDGGGWAVYDENGTGGHAWLVPIPVTRSVSELKSGGKVHGKVTPGRLGQPVVLQVKQGTRWVVVKRGKLKAGGAYAFALPAKTFRVVAPAVEGYATATGAALKP
jgi:hypothetical protein